MAEATEIGKSGVRGAGRDDQANAPGQRAESSRLRLSGKFMINHFAVAPILAPVLISVKLRF